MGGSAPPNVRLPSTVVVSTDLRFQRTPDGRVWTVASHDAAYWRAWLQAFDQVALVARVTPVDEAPVDAHEVTGEGVAVVGLPDFHSPLQLIRSFAQVSAGVRHVLVGDAFVLSQLGLVGYALSYAAWRRRRPYLAAVIGDPDAVFGAAAVGGRLRLVYRRLFRWATGLACRHASSVWYVAAYLEAKYPPDAHAPSFVRPDFVALQECGPPARGGQAPVRRLVTVGSLEQPYKGVEDLIEAVAALVGRGYDLHLTVVGGGRLLPALRERATAAGLGAGTTFTGWLAPPLVKTRLADADLFVLASHTEGMPRALIEAMAMGLPCVATRVGGIPDLLPDAVLATPRSPGELAGRIETFVLDPEYAEKEGGANLDRTERFRPARQAAEFERLFRAAWSAATR